MAATPPAVSQSPAPPAPSTPPSNGGGSIDAQAGRFIEKLKDAGPVITVVLLIGALGGGILYIQYLLGVEDIQLRRESASIDHEEFKMMNARQEREGMIRLSLIGELISLIGTCHAVDMSDFDKAIQKLQQFNQPPRENDFRAPR